MFYVSKTKNIKKKNLKNIVCDCFFKNSADAKRGCAGGFLPLLYAMPKLTISNTPPQVGT